jgi:hypothetical protein
MFLICESAVILFSIIPENQYQSVSLDNFRNVLMNFRNLAITIFRQTQFHYGFELQ